jgi:broad specificity phosphatase PhoE
MKKVFMANDEWLDEPSGAAKRIIFARHGEYECNLRGVVNCDSRLPYRLTEKGEQQALALGERLCGHGIELILSSEFLRARQTAWLASKALNLPVVVNSLANENRVGSALEGKPVKVFLESIRERPAEMAAEDGESFLNLKRRIHRLLNDVARSSPETVLVVSHGWPLQAVRVLKGEIRDDAAAMCVDMPGNCQTVSGTLIGGRFVDD